MYDAGTMTVWAKAITEHGCVDSVSIVITGGGLPPTLTLLSGNDNQKVAVNTAIAQIKYATTNASGATVTGLPAGVSGTWAANTVTISGAPSSTATTGAFVYTVTTASNGGCANTSVSGTITVPPPGCVPSTFTLGTVGFTSSDTYSRNGITLSAPVTATYCNNKTLLIGGAAGSGVYYADCYKHPQGYAGNHFTWCMVNEYADQLCQHPWRVPSPADYRMYTNGDPNNNSPNNSLKTGMGGWEAGGASPCSSEGVGYTEGYGTNGFYWSNEIIDLNQISGLFVNINAVHNTTYPLPRCLGAMLRCVQDTP
jgi:hypothetical protein